MTIEKRLTMGRLLSELSNLSEAPAA